MAQRPPTIAFEDVPLDEARRMSRGPWMEPALYHVLKAKIASLDTTATRPKMPEGTTPATMRHRILRVAAELSIPVTVRKVPGDSYVGQEAEPRPSQPPQRGMRQTFHAP